MPLKVRECVSQYADGLFLCYREVRLIKERMFRSRVALLLLIYKNTAGLVYDQPYCSIINNNVRIYYRYISANFWKTGIERSTFSVGIQ